MQRNPQRNLSSFVPTRTGRLSDRSLTSSYRESMARKLRAGGRCLLSRNHYKFWLRAERDNILKGLPQTLPLPFPHFMDTRMFQERNGDTDTKIAEDFKLVPRPFYRNWAG